MDSALATLDEVVGKTFDYIIAGGGTAGLALATRLSEDPTKKILVLEIGNAHFNDPMIYTPGSFGTQFGNKEYDHGYVTMPQKHCQDTVFHWNMGRGLGGSSGANFYLWHRPPQQDIDAWERLGNPGWNWKNFLKYSMKSENFIPPSEEVSKPERLTYDLKVHGTKGPIADTLSSLGIPLNFEPQGGNRIGSGMDLNTVDPRTSKRSSSVAYLQQAGPRPNLQILVNATVVRVLSSPGQGFVASGVEFLHKGQMHSVNTKPSGEVILSAGTIRSPQILELSGIGDPKVLASLGIDTKVNLPAVGTNLQDHLYAAGSYELNVNDAEKYHTFDALRDPVVEEEQRALYEERKGLFTLGNFGVTMCPLKSVSDRAHEIEANAPTGGTTPGLAEQYMEQIARLREYSANAEYITYPGFMSFPNSFTPGAKHITVATTLNRPFSRGTIHAVSRNPLDHPSIDPHYLEESIDLQTMIEQVKFIRKLVQTEPLASIVGREINPGPEVQSDEDIATWLKKYMLPVWHASSTCSMLPRDKGGVVDPELKVYGTENLRIVDLSIVPIVPCAHTQATVYAVAEQAADIIKGEFKA